MTKAIRPDVLRTAFATVVLALAALALRPLVLPIAAQIWPSVSGVEQGDDEAGRVVLPAKSVLRLTPKPRHDGSPFDPPLPLVAVVEAQDVPVPSGESGVHSEIHSPPGAVRPLAHRSRGPPGATSRPSAMGPSCGPIGVLVSSEPA